MKRKVLFALMGLAAAIVPIVVWRFRAHREAAV